MSLYGKPEYWQERYSKYPYFTPRNTEPFDWYLRFYAIKQQIRTSIPVRPQITILVPGCGTSRLPEELIEEGYQHVSCIDNSANCIKTMIQNYKDKSDKINFQWMDAKNLTFQSQSFDGIIDKALYDSVLCGQNAKQNSYKLLCELNRVLKRGGTYIMLSYESPTRRLPMLQKSHFNWKVSVQKYKKSSTNSCQYSVLEQGQENNYHYLYICKKNEQKS